MTSIGDGSVINQTSAEPVPSTPSWFGEVVLMATHLRKHRVLAKISEGVRFLAALTEAPIQALGTLFLDDLLSRPLFNDSDENQTGGLVDRAGNAWVVFDLDGTREAARQRALPQTEELPPAVRRLDDVCAPGYRGRKRGQVVRLVK